MNLQNLSDDALIDSACLAEVSWLSGNSFDGFYVEDYRIELKRRLSERNILAERNAHLEGLVTVIEDLQNEIEHYKDQWQDISTAPKDDFIQLIGYSKRDGIVIMYWWTSCNGWYLRDNCEVFPTEWMPLIQLPKEV